MNRKSMPNTLFGIALALVVAFGSVTATAQAPARGGQGRGGAGRGGNAATPTAPLELGPVSGNASIGKAVFEGHFCYACHGYNGEATRAPFVGRMNLSQNLATEQNFIAFLRARANVAPAGASTNMPNYPETTISDKLAKDLYAYVRSFKSTTPELKNVPTLNAIVEAASRPYKP